MNKPEKLYIAVPAYGQMPAEAVQSFVRYAAGGLGARLQFRIHDSLVTRSRNVLTQDFLSSDCDKLLFVDSDLIFDPGMISRIASHDCDIVGGLYPIKKDAPQIQWCANGLRDGTEEHAADGLKRVAYVGSGFCCIRRKVFETLIEKGLAAAYHADGTKRLEHDFWQVGVYQYPDGSRRYLSEDWMFCQLAMDCGYKVWLDTGILCRHVGTAVWPLSHHQVKTVSAQPAPKPEPALA